MHYKLFTFFLILFSLSCFSQENPDNSILWKIEGKNLSQPSYLYGTIHMIPKKQYFFFDYMKRCFINSDVLVLEANIDLPLSEKIDLAKQMLLPDNKTFKDYMGKQDYENLYKYLTDSLKINEKKVNRYMRFKPYFLSALILKETTSNLIMYEDKFTKTAKKQKKSIIGLETMQEQMDILNSMPIEEQFPKSNDDLNFQKEFEDLVNCYISQDLTHLYSLMQSSDDFQTFEGTFLIQRNNKWLSKIEEIISDKSTFIAVGCGHLPGNDGLINLLRKEGYTVTPVLN